jgi:hypothetical protein
MIKNGTSDHHWLKLRCGPHRYPLVLTSNSHNRDHPPILFNTVFLKDTGIKALRNLGQFWQLAMYNPCAHTTTSTAESCPTRVVSVSQEFLEIMTATGAVPFKAFDAPISSPSGDQLELR